MPDVEKMAAESLCYDVFGLSTVVTAGFAGNVVDDVRTFATDVVFARVFSAGGGA